MVLGVALCAGAAEVRADMLNESLGPRAVGAGEALSAAAYGSVAKSLNPAGVGLSKAYVVEGSYGFRPEDDAKIASVSICDSTRRVSACLSYDFVTASPTEGERTLHVVSLATAFPLSDKVILGVTNRYIRYSESGSEAMPVDNSRDGDWAADAGLVLRLSPMFNVAVVAHNLLGADEDQFPRSIGGGVAFFATPNLLIGADGRYATEMEYGRYSGGAEYFFSGSDGQQGFPIRLGYVYDDRFGAQFVTGGLGYVTQKFAIDAGVRKQVVEGDELTVQLGVRLFLPH
jgi:hypothetical protein